MPAICPDYAGMANQVIPDVYGSQFKIDPGWLGLAMALGFQPSPFTPFGQAGQAEMRYLSTLKQVMDDQLGGPGGAAAQLSPGNPVNGTNFAMQNFLNLAGALMNSPQGRMLMPAGNAAMFDRGFQFGGIPSTGVSDYMKILASNMNNGAANQGTDISAQGTPGQIQVTPGNSGQGAAPPQSEADARIANGLGAGGIGPTAGQPALPEPSTPTVAAGDNASARDNIISGLMGQAGINPNAGIADNLIAQFMDERGLPRRAIKLMPGGQSINPGAAQIPISMLHDFANWVIENTAGRLPNPIAQR